MAAAACNSPRTVIVVARRDTLNGDTLDLAPIEGRNYWVEGGQPRGLVLPCAVARKTLSLLKSPTGHGISLPTKRVTDAS
jgi:hypothetical protein